MAVSQKNYPIARVTKKKKGRKSFHNEAHDNLELGTPSTVSTNWGKGIHGGETSVSYIGTLGHPLQHKKSTIRINRDMKMCEQIHV